MLGMKLSIGSFKLQQFW